MGNYFYRARYYNQSLGRFFSRDPIMSLQSLYAYYHNSPTNLTDPTGMLADNLAGGNVAGTPMGMYAPWYVGPWLPCASVGGFIKWLFEDGSSHHDSGARIYYWPGTGEYYVRESDGTERCIQEGDDELLLYSEMDGNTGYTWKQIREAGGKPMGCPYMGGFDLTAALSSQGDAIIGDFMPDLGDGQFNPGQFGGLSGGIYSGTGESKYFSDPSGPTDPSIGRDTGLEPPGAGSRKRMTFLIPKELLSGDVSGPLIISRMLPLL